MNYSMAKSEASGTHAERSVGESSVHLPLPDRSMDMFVAGKELSDVEIKSSECFFSRVEKGTRLRNGMFWRRE